MKQNNIPTAVPIILGVISMCLGAISMFVLWWLSVIGAVFGAVSATLVWKASKEGDPDAVLLVIAPACGLAFSMSTLILSIFSITPLL